MSNFRKNPYADRLIKNGHRVMVTRNVNGKDVIVEDYFVTPEQIAEEIAQRDEILESRRVQG